MKNYANTSCNIVEDESGCFSETVNPDQKRLIEEVRYELRITDDSGAVATDTVTVTIQASNNGLRFAGNNDSIYASCSIDDPLLNNGHFSICQAQTPSFFIDSNGSYPQYLISDLFNASAYHGVSNNDLGDTVWHSDDDEPFGFQALRLGVLGAWGLGVTGRWNLLGGGILNPITTPPLAYLSPPSPQAPKPTSPEFMKVTG